ncbi:MAG: VWA domain-containing protein, partial [Thermoplasmata archaeon]
MSGIWSSTQIKPGEHSLFSTLGNELDDDGGKLYLINTSSGWIEDQLGYGQRGTVPDPISGESSARYWNGTNYEEYWTRSPLTSFGLVNDVPPWDFEHNVVLNEVLFNPQTAGEEFVEIFYRGNSSINLRGFIVVCDNAYVILSDVVLSPIRPHYVIQPPEFPGLFLEMEANGENLYLYGPTGHYLDMVGWSSGHEIGTSMTRVPDGNGSHDGFDDWSSAWAGWKFGKEPTLALINLWPDQVKYGDLEQVVSYPLTILNQPIDDIISLTVKGSSPWQIDFLTENWTPIADTNSDNLLDTGFLSASSFYNFTVNITIPGEPPAGNEMIAEIYANSSANRARDSAILVTRTYPHLEPRKRARPEEIYLEGTGRNEITEITLEVFGGGYIFAEKRPQDTIFVIDSSASMETSDPENLRLDAAKKYVDNMTVPDRAAVVDFDATADLVPKGNGDHLSNDYARIKQNIDSIDSNGGTNIGVGIEAANAELIGYGNASHLWVEILLTDGVEATSNYPFTSQQVQDAVDAGITIFSIGLGPSVNETLLKEIADRTGGKYYHARTPEALEEIYTRIGMLVYDIAGRDMNITDGNPMVRDVVPSYIHVDTSSFTTFPDVIYSTSNGTVFEWNVSQVRVSEKWEVSYKATSSRLGWVPVGVYPRARVSYIKWNGENTSLPFPNTLIHVVLPPISPPRNLRTSVENDVDIRLDWEAPDAVPVSHYLVYRAEHPKGFNFSTPTYNTSSDLSPERTNWTDRGAADPSAPREYYYTVRAVDSNGSVSSTSNTAGKWTRAFTAGLNSFSLPLEPFTPINISQLATSIPNTEVIRWMDIDGRWITHTTGMGEGVRDNFAIVGRGYEIVLSSRAGYTFVGFPGSMISFHEGFGDSIAFRNSLAATVQGRNITLSWNHLPGASSYEVFRSSQRNGLFDDALEPIGSVTSP